MEILEKFKEKLKKYLLEKRKDIKELEREERLASGIKGHIGLSKITTPILYDYGFELINERKVETVTRRTVENGVNLDFTFDVNESINLTEVCEYARKKVSLNYKRFEDIVRAIENGKVVKCIDLSDLMLALKILDIPVMDASVILGKFTKFNKRVIDLNKEESVNDKYISLLGEFFDKDGNFVIGNEDKLRELLFRFAKCDNDTIDTKYKDKSGRLLPMNIALLLLALDIYEYYISSDLKNDIVESKEEVKEIKLPISNGISKKEYYEGLQRLRRYYNNGELIKLPSDIIEFSALLNECNISDKEKRYIYGLINEELKESKKNKLYECLNDEEIALYEKGLSKLKEMNLSDGSYWILKQLLDNIKDALVMSIETTDREDKQYIMGEINILLSELKELIEPNIGSLLTLERRG